jgi:hypothetical protein
VLSRGNLKTTGLSLSQVLNSRLPGPRSGIGLKKPSERVSVMHDRVNCAGPAGSAQQVMAAPSGAEPTFELIDPQTADRPHPKTPIELLAAIAPTDPKFDLADFACRRGFLAAALEHVNDCICSAVVWMPVDGEDIARARSHLRAAKKYIADTLAQVDAARAVMLLPTIVPVPDAAREGLDNAAPTVPGRGGHG